MSSIYSFGGYLLNIVTPTRLLASLEESSCMYLLYILSFPFEYYMTHYRYLVNFLNKQIHTPNNMPNNVYGLYEGDYNT